MEKYIGALLGIYDSHFKCEASDIQVNKSWDLDEPEIPPIAVCVYRKADTGLPFDVLITAGMSWEPMSFGDAYKGEKWTTELIQYVEDAADEDISWLIWLSELPFFDKFPLGYGHTVSYPEPLYKDSLLSNFLFLNTLIRRDANIFEDFDVSPYPVDLLWVVPITSSEYEEKRKSGLESILDLFQENEHPVVLNKLRKSYIANA